MNVPAAAQQKAEHLERQQETAIESLESEHAERCIELAQRIGKYSSRDMSRRRGMVVLIYVDIGR